ncbi:class I SAM-dependent methyltransferase [Candidatus Pacearchaeota archaeon]|nr:class I SAM-dependent methyltransferase [Candidatus Pacearchaeota archaeon]
MKSKQPQTSSKLRINLKKTLLKFPFLYRAIHKILKKAKKINLNEEGVAGEELRFLLEYMGKNGIILEIGIFGGQTTRRLSKNNFVIGIDPYIGDSETGTLLGEYPEDVYLRFIKNTLGRKIMLFPLTSDEAFNFWNKNINKKIINSIFVDGLHTYEGVKTDFQWCKYLKKGGIIAFHDTNLKGVNDFLEDYLFSNQNYQYLGGKHTTKVFKKIK